MRYRPTFASIRQIEKKIDATTKGQASLLAIPRTEVTRDLSPTSCANVRATTTRRDDGNKQLRRNGHFQAECSGNDGSN